MCKRYGIQYRAMYEMKFKHYLGKMLSCVKYLMDMCNYPGVSLMSPKTIGFSSGADAAFAYYLPKDAFKVHTAYCLCFLCLLCVVSLCGERVCVCVCVHCGTIKNVCIMLQCVCAVHVCLMLMRNIKEALSFSL